MPGNGTLLGQGGHFRRTGRVFRGKIQLRHSIALHIQRKELVSRESPSFVLREFSYDIEDEQVWNFVKNLTLVHGVDS